MGAVQSAVETIALRPPPRPGSEPDLPDGAEHTTVNARYSKIPIYILYGTSLCEAGKRMGASASASAAATASDTERERPWIIFSHGSTEDCCTAMRFAETLAYRTASVVVMYEYPGYGMSTPSKPGTHEELPSEEGMYAAARETYRYVTEDRRIPSDRVVAMGWSIGSGPAMELASTRSMGGVIIQSAFRSIIRLRCCTPWSFGCDPFQNGDKAVKIGSGARVLILHGTKDEVVPFEHGVHLYESMKDGNDVTAVWLSGRKHSDLALDEQYARKIREWLDTVTASASGLSTTRHSDTTTDELHRRPRPRGIEMAHHDP